MFKALSFKLKIMAGIKATTVVCVAAVLAVILATGCDWKNPPDTDNPAPGSSTTDSGETSELTDDNQINTPSDTPNSDGNEMSVAEMDEFWLSNPGYRMSTIYPSPEDNAVASDDKFIRFVKEGDVFKFEYGIYRTSYWIGGEVTKAVTLGDYRFAFTLHIAATPATEMDPARPEKTETVSVHAVDHRINIKIESLGGGEWYSYEYGGETLEEAANNL